MATHALTVGADLVIGLPELQVDLRGGGHSSQTDLWALLGTPDRLISAAFEAKAGEPLGQTVGEWLDHAPKKSGKPERLRDIRERLGLGEDSATEFRYQLLHRAASATKLAKRFRAAVAVLVVHSFGGPADQGSWEAFQKFGQFMKATVAQNRLVQVGRTCEVPLLLGWLEDQPADEHVLRSAL